MYEKKKLEEIKKERERYEKTTLEKVLSKVPEKDRKFTNLSGIEIKRLYTPEDVKSSDYLGDIGFPGEYPFTRGVFPGGFRSREWTRRQVCGFGTPVETNERLRFLFENGQTGFSVVFDHPTNNNLDSDHELSVGFVGREGCPIDTLWDMQTLLEGLDQREISANLITGSPSLYAMYLAVADEREVPRDCLRGTLQNFALTGWSSGPKVRDNMRYSVDQLDFAALHQPLWNPLSISVRNVRDGGCTAVQEAAFGLAGGIAYIEHMLKRGHDIDKFASRITFFLNAHNDLFEEVAKYRAMRRMWARILREHFGAKDPRSWMMRFHVQTSGDSLTAQQPLNNIVRTSLQALAAVLGGAQSMHVNSVDEAFAIPTEDAAVLSLRTQQIILYESGVANTVDPLGGSYFVEHLTDRIEEEVNQLIEKIDGMGGMVEACASGWVARQTQDSAWEYQKQVERNERIVVGVNEFQSEKESMPIEVFEVDPVLEKKQIERLKKVLKERDEAKAEKAKKDLLDVCRGKENTMPATIEAVKAYVSVGEIGGIYDEALGEDLSNACASQ